MSESDYVPIPGNFSYGETVSVATQEQLCRLPTDILRILYGNTNYSDINFESNSEEQLRNRWIQQKLNNHEWFELSEFRTAPLPAHPKFQECDEHFLKKVRRDV